MAIKIAISNQKGGVGKTTTALNIADALIHCGKKVLFLDLDPQCNSTSSYKAETGNGVVTISDVMNKLVSIKDAIQHTAFGDIVAGDRVLANDESKFQSKIGGYNIIKKCLSEVEDDYDFVIMDTPPNLGIYMVNALTAANGTIIPIKAEKYAIDGLNLLIDTINDVIDNSNPDLKNYGVVLTAYDKRNSLDNNIWSELPEVGKANNFKVFSNPIRICQSIKDAQAMGVSLYEKFPSCNGSIDYVNVVKELLTEV